MAMMSRDGGTARFFVLIMERDDLFAIRPWDRRDWARVEIRPREPVDDGVRRLIGSRCPVSPISPAAASAGTCSACNGLGVGRAGRLRAVGGAAAGRACEGGKP